MDELREHIAKIIKEMFGGQEVAPVNTGVPVVQPKPSLKPKAVRFNPGLETEYVITFSERGFLVGDTRMSFDEIQDALSKGYTITFKDGTVLDAVKMQQILKYKDIY